MRSPQRHDGDIWLAVLRIPTTCLNRILCKCYRRWVEIEWCVFGALEKGVEIKILQHITIHKVRIIHFVCALLLKSASNPSRSQESSKRELTSPSRAPKPGSACCASGADAVAGSGACIRLVALCASFFWANDWG